MKDNKLTSSEKAGLMVVDELSKNIEEEITGFSGNKLDGLNIKDDGLNNLYDRIARLGLNDNQTYAISDIKFKDNVTDEVVGDLITGVLGDDAALLSGNLFSQEYQITTKKMKENNFIINYMPKLFRAIKDMVYEVISPDVQNDANFPIEIMNSKNITKEEIQTASNAHDLDTFLEQTYVNAFVQGVEYTMVIPQKEIIKSISNGGFLHKYMESNLVEEDDLTIIESNINKMNEEDASESFYESFIEIDDPFESLDEPPFLESHMGDILESAVRADLVDADDNSLSDELIEATFRGPTLDNDVMKRKMTAILGNKRISNIKQKKKKQIKSSGAYVTRLEPNRTFPFELNGRTLGYYYIQKVDVSDMESRRRGFLINNILGKQTTGRQASAYGNANTSVDALRQHTLTKITRLLHRNMTDKFIADNKTLMPQIMDLFHETSLYDSKLSIKFIPAKYVETFKINGGVSVLALARIPAKMFILQRINDQIQTLFEDKDKYVISVSAGRGTPLYSRSMRAIDQFNKVFRNPNELSDINKAFTRMMSYNKLIIPVDRDSGDKGFSVERIEGSANDSSGNSERLRELEREALSLLDRPQEMIDEMDRLDFATRIAAANQSGAMKILKHQKDLKKATNSFLTKWCRYEFGDDTLIARCPLSTPKAIQAIQKDEKLETAIAKAEKIIQLIAPDSDESITDDLRTQMLIRLVKKDVPFIPLQDYEEELELLKDTNLVKAKIKETEEE